MELRITISSRKGGLRTDGKDAHLIVENGVMKSPQWPMDAVLERHLLEDNFDDIDLTGSLTRVGSTDPASDLAIPNAHFPTSTQKPSWGCKRYCGWVSLIETALLAIIELFHLKSKSENGDPTPDPTTPPEPTDCVPVLLPPGDRKVTFANLQACSRECDSLFQAASESSCLQP
jgi:hypothetical protein